MKNDVTSKAILLFIAFLLLCTVAGVSWYFLSASQYTKYQIHTPDPVSGLLVDAPVEFHGVDVGKVENIEIVNPHSVGILLRIKTTAPITAATVATITSRGLATRGFTGYVYIALEDVSTDFRRLTTRPGERYPTIATAPSKSVTLDTTIFQVNENVQILTELLQSVLDKNTIASLKQSVDSLQRFTKILADNSKKLSTIISNTEYASKQLKPLLESSSDTMRVLQTQILPEANKVLTNFDNLSNNQLKPLLESGNDTLRVLQTQTLPEANKVLTNFDNLSNNQLKPLLESGNDTVRALQTQILPQAHKALTSLDNLSRTLTGVATKINRDPSIVIRGTTPPASGPGEAK
jgi:phospholipid/cholesterol/gamma-HCH transport system substrate-binding protein